MEAAKQTTEQTVNNRKLQEPEEVEIDLLELGREMLRHWFTILVAVIAGGVIAYAYSRFLIVPQYESTATMYILTKETTIASLADLQIGTQLTNDYQVVVTTRTVLQNTIDALGLQDQLSYSELKGKLKITNPSSTRMLQITAKDASPVLAKEIANTVAKNASEFIADTMEITPPKVIEEGVVADKKSSPSNGKNALIGALIGFLIAAGIITVRYLMNDAVKSEEDVRKYLGLSVLATLPERTEQGNAKTKKEQNAEKRLRLRQSRRK